MKKILYIANARIPTEKAHGIAIMKMCEAFASKGIEVELVVPKRLNPIKEDPFAYYGIERNFKITKVPVIDLVSYFGKAGFFLELITYTFSAAIYCMIVSADIFYGRDEGALGLISMFKKNVVWEAHTAKKKWVAGGLLKRCKALVVISNGLKNYYRSFGISENKILVAPSGVDVEKISIKISKEDARQTVGLPNNKKIVLYTGHLYPWKGVDVLAKAAQQLGSDITVIFIGGTKNDVDDFKKKFGHIQNITILGHRAHHEIPFFLKAADVLVLPNSAREEVSRVYTSPMKLFEYMASERPIVASNLPAMREILNEENAFLVTPDSPDDLAANIQLVFSNEEKAEMVSARAFYDVQQFSWVKRADAIIHYCS